MKWYILFYDNLNGSHSIEEFDEKDQEKAQARVTAIMADQKRYSEPRVIYGADVRVIPVTQVVKHVFRT